jgi:hypothetical protein
MICTYKGLVKKVLLPCKNIRRVCVHSRLEANYLYKEFVSSISI